MCLFQGSDSMLHVGVCRTSLASPMLVKESKEMEITWSHDAN
jgi:hypothetical protein